MKTKLFIVALSAATIQTSFAQDVIIKNSGEEIKAKIIEIGSTEIKFKKFDNPDGPVYIIPKNDLLLIRYENGNNEVFKPSDAKNNKAEEPSIDYSMQGRLDANAYYKGRNSGAVWTGVSTAFCSPFIGVIPAISCSFTEPAHDNLNVQHPEYIKNKEYYDAYVKQAHKIKKRKVWTQFGIGSGTWLLLIILLA